MTNQIILYRQIYNITLNKWTIPQRLMSKNKNHYKWKTINNYDFLKNVSRGDYTSAIQALQWWIDNIKDVAGRSIWETKLTRRKMFNKKHGWDYIIYHLRCMKTQRIGI